MFTFKKVIRTDKTTELNYIYLTGVVLMFTVDMYGKVL